MHEPACEDLPGRITVMVEMFRITHSRGKVTHVEGRKQAIELLLEMHSEEESSDRGGYGTPKTGTLIERMFRSRKGLPEKSYYSRWGMKLEKFLEGEWVEITYDFVPAHLTLDGIMYKDAKDG